MQLSTSQEDGSYQNPIILADMDFQPDHGFPASRTVRNKYLLFKPPSLWYFVLATLAN